MLLPEHLTEFSNAPNGGEVDLKKHNASCSFPDDSTCTTTLTSMSSFNDSITVPSLSTRSSFRSSKRGSILKSSSSLCGSSSSNLVSPRRTSRISFSTTPNQVFTIENKEEYYDDMFYDQESLADFRYEALMFEAGMVDEDGTPLSLIQSANETNDKYETVDKMNGSLDFDDLLMDELNNTDTGNPLEDVEQDKAYSRESIKQMRKSIDGKDVQWQANSELFCNLADWDDDFDDDESVAGDDELGDDLDSPFTALDAGADAFVGAQTPKEKFEQQRRQLSFHKNKQRIEGHFLNQRFSAFNLKDDNDGLVFESSDDGSQHSQESTGNSSQEWEETFACEDDSRQSRRSVPCESDSTCSDVIGDTSGRSHLRRPFVKRDSLRESLKSLSDVFSNMNSCQDLVASLEDDSAPVANGEGKRPSRLMAKMRGLRESLRSIQNLDDSDSDDDSEWGDEKDQALKTIDAKNLKRSLIGKHKIYSPVPNQSHLTIGRKNSVKEMTIPEL